MTIYQAFGPDGKLAGSLSSTRELTHAVMVHRHARVTAFVAVGWHASEKLAQENQRRLLRKGGSYTVAKLIVIDPRDLKPEVNQ